MSYIKQQSAFILQPLGSSEDLTLTELTPNQRQELRNASVQFLLTCSSILETHIQKYFFGP